MHKPVRLNRPHWRPGWLTGLAWLLAALAMAMAGAVCAAETLTVVTEEYPPLNYVHDGKLTGYAVEIAHELLARSRLSYTMNIYPWARAYQMAQRRPNVLIFSIVRTPEREKAFQWIAALTPRNVYVYKLAQRKDIALKSVADLRRYKIATNRGDVTQDQLEAAGLKVGRQIDLSNRDETNLHKLTMGRVDLMVATEPAMRILCEQTGTPLATVERTIVLSNEAEYYIAASLGTPAGTVDLLREEFGKLQKSDAMKRIANKYNMAFH